MKREWLVFGTAFIGALILLVPLACDKGKPQPTPTVTPDISVPTTPTPTPTSAPHGMAVCYTTEMATRRAICLDSGRTIVICPDEFFLLPRCR